MNKLIEMLRYKRPHGSVSEREFIKTLILTPCSAWEDVKIELMGHGDLENIVVTVPGDSETIFSCHVDTVHQTSGMQEVEYDEAGGIIFKKGKFSSSSTIINSTPSATQTSCKPNSEQQPATPVPSLPAPQSIAVSAPQLQAPKSSDNSASKASDNSKSISTISPATSSKPAIPAVQKSISQMTDEEWAQHCREMGRHKPLGAQFGGVAQPGFAADGVAPVGRTYNANDFECLGADDACGVWIMMNMIEAQIPGVYVFHRGEECGGLGSRWILTNKKEWLKQFKRAIAFDRKDVNHIVTHQGGQECASQEFALELAKRLNAVEDRGTDNWRPDNGGSFTDVKVYAGIIPECVNMSCAYDHQHGPDETVDTWALEKMMKHFLAIKWSDLPTTRVPKEPEAWPHSRSYNKGYTVGEAHPSSGKGKGKGKLKSMHKRARPASYKDYDAYDIRRSLYFEIKKAVTQDSQWATSLIFEMADQVVALTEKVEDLYTENNDYKDAIEKLEMELALLKLEHQLLSDVSRNQPEKYLNHRRSNTKWQSSPSTRSSSTASALSRP